MTNIKNVKSESLVCVIVLNDTEKSKRGLRSMCVTVKEASVWNMALDVFVLWRDNSNMLAILVLWRLSQVWATYTPTFVFEG